MMLEASANGLKVEHEPVIDKISERCAEYDLHRTFSVSHLNPHVFIKSQNQLDPSLSQACRFLEISNVLDIYLCASDHTSWNAPHFISSGRLSATSHYPTSFERRTASNVYSDAPTYSMY